MYLDRCPVLGLAQKALPPGLSHSKDLEFRLREFSESKYEVSLNIDLAAFVTRILKEMPNIQTFRYVMNAILGTCTSLFIVDNSKQMGELMF